MNCSFYTDDNFCHQLLYTRKTLVRNVRPDEKDLLECRSKVPKYKIKTICMHHEQVLLRKFSAKRTKCCNPFESHKKPRTKSLRLVTQELYEKMHRPPDIIIPGEKLCLECVLKLTGKLQTPEFTDIGEDASGSKDDLDDEGAQSQSSSSILSSPGKEQTLHDVNTALVSLNESPVRTGGLKQNRII